MAFEVIFKYHEKLEQGGYDTANQKEFTKGVGKGTEEVPLDKLAKVVLGQLARRDIWVVDADIYEITKKKVSFKETAGGGIVIKHKKFELGNGSLTQQDIVETEVTTILEPQQQISQVSVQLAPQQRTTQAGTVSGALVYQNKKPLRYEVFDPQVPGMADAARRRGYRFTLGRQYPIFEEKPVPGKSVGMLYYTIDDDGNRQILNDLHFTPVVGMLEQGFDSNERLYIEKVREKQAEAVYQQQPVAQVEQFMSSLPEIINPLAKAK